MFASHADIDSFVHRATVDTINSKQDFVSLEYFQFARNEAERKIHTFTMLHVYIMIIDVSGEFYVREQKLLPAEWYDEIHKLGALIEHQAKILQTELHPTDIFAE
ncbi:MAG: hypothetical protein PQ612_09310 [Rickettsiales bacterium]|nr:hypothetical protein [Pseudomonadota bacterium]MDA0967461.1 hypothetical protein [Pseudomonadota bacterium]MDG4544171.1 hypothetical protein [Rickettsiales bacterium]MDG4546352.1 hypothetical protein [Rickettsiales bacterium]MDG4548495.1 hypothetical protein [Rickettsiales bacterium]